MKQTRKVVSTLLILIIMALIPANLLKVNAAQWDVEETDVSLVSTLESDPVGNDYDSVFKNYDGLSIEEVKKFYYNQLSDFEKNLYDKMSEFTFEQHSLEITYEEAGTHDMDEFRKTAKRAWAALVSDDPTYHMYLSRGIADDKDLVQTEGGYSISIERSPVSEYAYRKSLARIKQLKNTFYNTDEERYITIIKLWDYMRNGAIVYDPYYPMSGEKKGAYNDCAAGIFYYGSAVCAGYTDAAKIIFNELNIPCIVVGNGGHAWNFVELEDGKWYSIDFTGGRPLSGRYSGGYANEENYFITKLYIAEEGDFDFPALANDEYVYDQAGENFDYELSLLNFEEWDGRFAYTVNDDGISCTVTDYYGLQEGDLAIPEVIDGYTVTDIGSEAFILCKGFTGELILPGTIENVGDYAFQQCYGLTGELKLPDGIKIIGKCAFQGCADLSGKLSFPEGITEIGEYAFYDCEGFTGSIRLPDSLVAMRSAFWGCKGLNGDLYIPDSIIWDDAMDWGTKFSSYTVSEANENYVTINGILYKKDLSILLSCPGGKEGDIIIPEGVTEIGTRAFYGCDSLTGTLSLPDSLCKISREAFRDTKFSGSLVIPDKVQTIEDYAFDASEAFGGELVLGEGLSEIGFMGFSGCKFSGDLVIPDRCVRIAGWAFTDCDFGGRLTLPEGLISVGDLAFSGNYFTGELVLPDSLQEVGGFAFANNRFSYFVCHCGEEYLEEVSDLENNTLIKRCTHCHGEYSVDGEIKMPYYDVAEADWFYDGVKFAYKNSIMSGMNVGDGKVAFAPDMTTSRAMVVTVLYRMAGSPQVENGADGSGDGAGVFPDVLQNEYYADPVAWGNANGIVTGYGGVAFVPNGEITREQMATFLFRYANYKGYDTSQRVNINSFTDSETDPVSGYAAEAISWANANGFITGFSNGDGTYQLSPSGNATRAQVATILSRFCEKYGME